MSNNTDDMVFDHNSCPSLDQMRQYRGSTLSDQESHAMEKHLLSCSMCSEVVEHITGENIAELTALTASIDHRVDERIGGGGSNAELNFNLYMIIAATLTGALILGGNVFMRTDLPVVQEDNPIAVEIVPQDREDKDERTALDESTSSEQPSSEEDLEQATPDSTSIIDGEIEEDIDGLAVKDPDDGQNKDEEEPADEEFGGDPTIEPDPTPSETFLTASINLFSVERIGQPLSTKGSTNKKVKIKSTKGYAPGLENEEGFPSYTGGDEQLKEDIIKRINDLQLILAEGGDVGIVFTVSASGAIGTITVDDEVSVALAEKIKSAIAGLSGWVPGNVEIKYTLKLGLQ